MLRPLDARFCVMRTLAGEVVVPVPSDEGVAVEPSRIPGAGCGLFARRMYAPGELVTVYRGTVLRTLQALRLVDKTYLMRLGPQCYIDAREHTSVRARYINDSCDATRHNVQFHKRAEEYCALVLATRYIEVGDELYVDYGKWYWAGSRGNSPPPL